MTLTTNKILMDRREAGCFAITSERKYYHLPQSKTFVERSLRTREWQVSMRGTIIVPRLGSERLQNEAAVLHFIGNNTSIPVPGIRAAFEDDEAFYLVIDYIDGVGMNELDESAKPTVADELKEHLKVLHSLRSRKLGGPTGLIIPPYRALVKTFRDDWNIPDASSDEYVFCHNDLSQHNVIVNPDTLKINAIIDWEYAGFYPPHFESPFFERVGPSVALSGEQDDSDVIAAFLKDRHQLNTSFQLSKPRTERPLVAS